MVIRRFDVFLTKLDPVVGSEMSKTRPCVVITPDEMNRHINTVLIAPLTSTIRKYPYRVTCVFAGREGQIALDQIRCADKSRLLRPLGRIETETQSALTQTLVRLFR